MATELTKEQWIEILRNPNITRVVDLEILQVIYAFEGHQACASQVGLLIGHKGKSTHSPINSKIGAYAKRIAKHYAIAFTKRDNGKDKFWDLFFNGRQEGSYFIWQLKSTLIAALRESQLTGERPYAEEIPTAKDAEALSEGIRKTIIINAYERNPKARSLCIGYWGSICRVCRFNFEAVYGSIGKGYIHVHHLTPISQIKTSYKINPFKDLRPVCPNCHAMLHTQNPPLTIEELKKMIKPVA